jgi:hypothetical protein
MMTHKSASWRQIRRHRGRTERGSCPPHTPIMVSVSEEGYYLATCLACGLAGPKREDAWEAKQAFDESFPPLIVS